MTRFNAPAPAQARVPAQQEQRKITFSQAISTSTFQKAINNSIRDTKQANRFVSAITSAVAVNPALQECDAGTILSGALLGESLGLSPSPQLGQYYLVPFKQKAKVDQRTGELISPERTTATFILGYKGYIQLALRSGYYKKLNVIPIKQGEFVSFNPLTEEIVINPIDDWDQREAAQTIGYYAMFEYMNGFQKAMYWSKEKMLSHADHYSMAFSKAAYQKIQNGEISDRDMWKYSSFWYKDFDGMAQKTMLRQLISKWGMMSMELQDAISKDDSMNEINMDTGDVVQIPFEQSPDPDYTEVVSEVPEPEPSPAPAPNPAPAPAMTSPPQRRGARGKVDLGAL